MSFFGTNDAIYGSGAYGSASYGRTTPIVIPTGVSATGAVTAADAVITFTIGSVSATGAIGAATFANDTVEALGSVAGTTALGSLNVSAGKQLTGVSATGSVGDISATAFFGINDALYGTGVYGTAIYGQVTSQLQMPSLVATGGVGSVSVGTGNNVTGVSATGGVGSVITIPFIVDGVQGTGAVSAVVGFVITYLDLDSVAATGQIGTVEPQITEDLAENPIPSVFATASVGGAFVVHVVEKLASAPSTASLGTITTSGVVTAFVAANYSRQRTLKIIPSEKAAQRRKAA